MTRIDTYTIVRIAGGVAVYDGVPTNPAHAARIFATTDEARAWIEGR